MKQIKERNLNQNNLKGIQILISKGTYINAKDIIYQITKNHF